MAYIGQGAEGNFTTTNAKDNFSGDGSTVAFTLSAGASTNNVDVFVNNVRQEPTTAYSVDGTTLTFTEAPSTGTDNIYVVNRGPAELTASHPASQALEAYSGDFTTDVTIGGELDATTAVFDRASTDGTIVDLQKDGTSVGSIGAFSTSTSYTGASSGIYFNGVNINPTTGDPTVRTDNINSIGQSSQRFKDLYLGGGVYLGGTGSANKLEDYEEGTFSPTYIGSTTNPTITYDRQNGHYVKIGRQVIASIEIRTDAFSGGVGSIYVGGLPFTPVAPTGTVRAGTAHIGYSSAFNGETPQTAYINGGYNAVILLRSSVSSSWGGNDNGVVTSDFGGGANDNFLMITAIYTV